MYIVTCLKNDYEKMKEKADRIPMTDARVVAESPPAKDNIPPITNQGSEYHAEIQTMTQMKIKSLETTIEEALQALLNIKKELS